MNSARPTETNRIVTTVAACAGIVVFILVVAGSLVLGFLKPGYNPILSTLSELGESGGVTAPAAAVLFILIGAGEIIFAVGLYLWSGRSMAALFGTIFLTANGLFDYIGSSLFPVDAGGRYDSPAGQVHFIVSLIGMAVMVLPAIFYWRAFAKAKRSPATQERNLTTMKTMGMMRAKRNETATFVAAIVIILAAVIFNLAFFTETCVGLAQRFLDWCYCAWILFLAVRMLKARSSYPVL
jgi:hypothetical protein